MGLSSMSCSTTAGGEGLPSMMGKFGPKFFYFDDITPDVLSRVQVYCVAFRMWSLMTPLS